MHYTYKQIWLINFPVMMSILMEQLINITDAVFLGHVGEVELGASAIAGIYYLAVYMLGFGFSIGLQVMIARRNGECDYGKAGKIFFQGFFFLSGLAILLCLLMQASSPFILGRLISSPEIYRAVIQYLDWRSFGLLFSFPFLVIRSFLVGITCTRALSWAAAVAVVINIPLNYILIIVGGLGPPRFYQLSAKIFRYWQHTRQKRGVNREFAILRCHQLCKCVSMCLLR